MALPIAGTTDIPTAGTRVQINNTARRCLTITFKAKAGNTGNVYMGGSTVSSTNGFELRANESISFNLAAARVSCLMSDFWVDTATNGNDVDWLAIIWP